MFQFIWNEYLDGEIDLVHEDIVNTLNGYYDEVPKIEHIDYKGFKEFAKQYCRYLSSKVSEKGYISMHEIFEFLKASGHWS